MKTNAALASPITSRKVIASDDECLEIDLKNPKSAKPLPEIKKLVVTNTKEQTINMSSMNLFNKFVVCISDAVLRGPVRFVEKFIDNQFLRVLYRLATESVRKTSEVLLVNFLENKKTTKKDVVPALVRALEHVPATAIVEPNLFESGFQRLLAGFGNMTLRFITRFGFCQAGVIKRGELGEKNLPDEFLSRSLFRTIFVNSDNPALGIGVRILEQALINLNLHVMKPLNRLIQKV
ncbi:MAG: hypothetical protein HY094_02975 [Candidatus Melainabacteria bacterium]|nr:hypothetical protein [Candidatus Melainabacteria bacterium]